jgi:hypothetical protein
MKSRALEILAFAYLAGAAGVAVAFFYKFFRGERNIENRLVLKRAAIPTIIATLVFCMLAAVFEDFLFRQLERDDMIYGMILGFVLAPPGVFLPRGLDVREHQHLFFVFSVTFYTIIFAVIAWTLMFVTVKARKNK